MLRTVVSKNKQGLIGGNLAELINTNRFKEKKKIKITSKKEFLNS